MAQQYFIVFQVHVRGFVGRCSLFSLVENRGPVLTASTSGHWSLCDASLDPIDSFTTEISSTQMDASKNLQYAWALIVPLPTWIS